VADAVEKYFLGWWMKFFRAAGADGGKGGVFDICALWGPGIAFA
jgi:hypothetical protein